MSVNRVWLIGRVAAISQATATEMLVTIATVNTSPAGDVVERHPVQYSPDVASQLIIGNLVLVEGRLTMDEHRQRHLVVARRLVQLAQARTPESQAPAVGTHASPVTHERVGHFRRVGVGTDRERLVWVRLTTVGGERASG